MIYSAPKEVSRRVNFCECIFSEWMAVMLELFSFFPQTSFRYVYVHKSLVITTGPWSGMDKGTRDEVTEIAKRSRDKGTFSVYFNLALQHTVLLTLSKVVPIPVPVLHGLLSTYCNQAKS